MHLYIYSIKKLKMLRLYKKIVLKNIQCMQNKLEYF